jgi:hypothetical protein
MFSPIMQVRQVEDILLFIKDSSIEEAVRIIEDLGRGTEDVYSGELGCSDIRELAAGFDGSLLACIIENLTFTGGPYKLGWFDGDLQKILYDRVLYAIVQHGPSYVATIVGLDYGA